MQKSLPYFLALITLFAMTACNSQDNDNQANSGEDQSTVTITHALDTVQVPVNPERVVVLDFGALENLDLIDANVVGIPKTAVPDYVSEYGEDSSIANLGSLVEVNMEEINELQPDLIILGGRLSDSYEEISQIAPTILPASSIEEPIGALEENLTNLGKIFEEEELFEQEIQSVKEKVNSIRTIVEDNNAKALILLHNRGRFSAYGSGSRFGIVHDILGVNEAMEDLDTHLHGTRVSNEFIQEANPDILYVVDRSAAIGDQALNKSDVKNELLQQTNAYQNDRIIYLDPQAWYLSGGGGITSINIMIDEVAQAFD